MIRPPAVADLFYPGNAAALRSQIDSLLKPFETKKQKLPKALIAPHAGYKYSGPIAASAFHVLKGNSEHIRLVVVIGPAHRVPFDGVALSSADSFATPLGNVEIDKDAQAKLAQLPQVMTFDLAHEPEHSLEVELPFLQALLPNFKIIPIVVGDARSAQVAEVLERVWGGDETLIVISSDLSHFLPYDEARTIDAKTADAINEFRPDLISPEQACGRLPINGFLTLAKGAGFSARTIDLRNSGDTAGDKSQVVGYGAFDFVAQRR